MAEEARRAEEARLAEEIAAYEEAMAAERAKREAAEAEKAAAAAKAEAEAKMAEAQKAMEAASAAREAKAELNKQKSKTSEVFKTTIASSDQSVMPAISALSAEEGYSKALEDKAEKVARSKAGSQKPANNTNRSVKNGASSGAETNASKSSEGRSYPAERKKTKSNQLGTLLNGNSHKKSDSVPMWAGPEAFIAPFKESEEAKEARILEENKRIEEEEAKKRREEQAQASYTSIADSERPRKSAFFNRAKNTVEKRDDTDQEEHSSAYGGIVRPSGVVDEDRDLSNKNAPAMGVALEGQRPSIMDPSVDAVPTASKPVKGFKASGRNNMDEN